MQENLIGYLLGALDGPEQDAVREQLQRDSLVQQQLLEWENRLAPLERDRWQYDPPSHLTAATCAMVARQAGGPRVGRSRWSAVTAGWNPRQHGWDLIDVAVAAGIFFAAALLFFPAIANSRQQARLLACQEKLRSGSVALALFGERHNGVFPFIPSRGNGGVAGFYAVQLMDGGFLTQHSDVLCPAAQFNGDEWSEFRVPTVSEVRHAMGAELVQLQRLMGGSYFYTLGHWDGAQLRAQLNRGRDYVPVMSDGSAAEYGSAQFSAHGNGGVNVIYEGGNLRFIVGITRQHPYFVSDQGLIEAGRHVDDAVLAPSWSRPLPSAEETHEASRGVLDHARARCILFPAARQDTLRENLELVPAPAAWDPATAAPSL